MTLSVFVHVYHCTLVYIHIHIQEFVSEMSFCQTMSVSHIRPYTYLTQTRGNNARFVALPVQHLTLTSDTAMVTA
jgi:hypothetical protein